MDEIDVNQSTSLLTDEYGTIPKPVKDNRNPYQKQRAINIILASILFERIAFYSLGANLVVYLESNELNWRSKNSVTTLYIFYGTTYISTLLFAIVSDAKFGRAKTIIIGFILYVIGYIMVILILYDRTKTHLCQYNNIAQPSVFQENCASAILGILICTAIGAGAVQSNMAVFGAEQIQESKMISRYFDKYMVAVNIGGIIATSAIPYIQNQPQLYYIAYIVAVAMLLIGALLFIVGLRYYIHVESNETVITKCIPVVISAFQSRNKFQKNKRLMENVNATSIATNLQNASASLTDKEESIRIDQRPSTFLDFAKVANKGRYQDRIVDDVKSLRGALIVFSLLIPYWLIYGQLDATFHSQGQQMSGSNLKSVNMWVSLGDPVTIIIGIVILNMFVYKHVDSQNPIMDITGKFVIGMCFASITMCITGIVEGLRQDQCHPSLDQHQSNLTIYAQLPQNIGMGLSELFATVASYEFAYFAAPRSAQSLFMSLRFCSLGISSVIATFYVHVFPTTSVDLNFSCLTEKKWLQSFSYYFFILAVLQLIFIIILILCQKKFGIIKLHLEKLKQNQLSLTFSDRSGF